MYSIPNLHKTDRHHFLCNFFQYLQYMEGGLQKQAQALIITRHVHKIMEEIDPKGTGLKALTQNNSLDIWEKFAGPRLSGKINKGDTLKVYVRSLQFFALFITKRLFYNLASSVKTLSPPLSASWIAFPNIGRQSTRGLLWSTQQGKWRSPILPSNWKMKNVFMAWTSNSILVILQLVAYRVRNHHSDWIQCLLHY